MGMFDDLSVADSLPFSQEMKDLGLDKNTYVWQTKDLGSSMEYYTIQGGKLFVQKFKINKWEEGDPKAKNFMDRIGHLVREEPYMEEVFHHGEVYFYDFKQDVQDKWDCWIEFKATFTKGELSGIELVKFDKEDNSERLERDRKWREEFRKNENLWRNKYFLHTKAFCFFRVKVWYWFWQKVSDIAFRIKGLI